MKIYLDMDEVIIDSIEAVVTILNEKYKGEKVLSKDITTWNFTNKFPKETNKSIEDIFNSGKFFDIVKFKKGAKEFILCHLKNIVIITKGSEINLVKKREWLEENGLGDVKFIGLPLNKSKGSINMNNDLNIDDSERNLYESNASIKILFNNNCTKKCDWNKNWKGISVVDFDDINFLLNSIFKNFLNSRFDHVY